MRHESRGLHYSRDFPNTLPVSFPTVLVRRARLAAAGGLEALRAGDGERHDALVRAKALRDAVVRDALRRRAAGGQQHQRAVYQKTLRDVDGQPVDPGIFRRGPK